MGLDTADAVLLAGFLLANVSLGIFFSRRNKSTGWQLESVQQTDGAKWRSAAVSLLTSCTGGLTFLGSSAEFYYQGPTYLLAAIPILLSGPIAAYLVVPVLRKTNTQSLNKYLGARFGSATYYTSLIAFVLQTIVYNAIALYLPCMATSKALGIPPLHMVFALGLVCLAYNALGHLKRLVWLELIQALVILVGLFVLALLGTWDVGGLRQVWTFAAQEDRLNFSGLLNLDLTTRHTLFSLMVGATLNQVFLASSSQLQLERALDETATAAAGAGAKRAQALLVLQSLCGALMVLASSYLGAVLVAAYRSCDPFLADQIVRRDAVLIHYLAHRLAQVPGLRGLFIAGVLSASLANLSAFARSTATLATDNFVEPLQKLWTEQKPAGAVRARATRILAAFFCAICVLVACSVEQSNSRLLQTALTVIGALGVPILAAFLLGSLLEFVNGVGTLCGLTIALPFGASYTLFQSFVRRPLDPSMPIFFSDHCSRVFNASLEPGQLRLLDMTPVPVAYTPETRTPFELVQISYMSLPAVQLLIMLLVVPICSLLAGNSKGMTEKTASTTRFQQQAK